MIGNKIRSDELARLFGHLQLVMARFLPEFGMVFIVLKDPATNEFFIGPNSDRFLSMFLRYLVQPDELLGAASFKGCETKALCVRCGDTLRVYFRGEGAWDSQGELHLCKERKQILRIELVDMTINEKWNFAGIGMNVVYETQGGKSYARVYDNALRPIHENADE